MLRHWYGLIAVWAIGGIALVLLESTGVGGVKGLAPNLHVTLIGIATAISAVLGSLALRAHVSQGSAKPLALGAALLAFAAVYIWHGVYTHAEVPFQFLIYGPTSRVVFGLAMIGVGSTYVASSGARTRNVALVAIGVVVLAGISFLVSPGLAGFGASTLPADLNRLRLVVETLAILGALFALFRIGRRSVNWAGSDAILLLGLGFITLQSVYFMFAQAWTVVWWGAHALGATGTLILSWGVIVVSSHEDQAREVDHWRELERARTTFINTAAHELNTPLTPIKLQLYFLIADSSNLTEKQRRAVTVLSRNVDRLCALSADILSASRMQAGRLAIEPGPVDLRRLVEEAAQSFAPVAEEAGVALVVESEVENGRLVADSGRINQVLTNLLSNAFKLTPRGGRVTLRLRAAPGRLIVQVDDTGIGIAPSDIRALFQPFSRIAESEGGTGLGLFICRGIIEQHEGRIWVESAGPGQGASFAFELPAPEGDDSFVPSGPDRGRRDAALG